MKMPSRKPTHVPRRIQALKRMATRQPWMVLVHTGRQVAAGLRWADTTITPAAQPARRQWPARDRVRRRGYLAYRRSSRCARVLVQS